MGDQKQKVPFQILAVKGTKLRLNFQLGCTALKQVTVSIIENRPFMK